MDEPLRTILVSGLVSLVVAVLTAIITSKQAIKQEVKKAIYAKREDTYICLFNLLNVFKDNPYLVYNQDQFVQPLSDLRTKLSLFASKNVLKTFEPFYSMVKDIATAYLNEYVEKNMKTTE